MEDNPADVRLIGDAFEEIHANHHLNVAADGEDALDFLFRRGAHINAPEIDLVLLDLNLPVMNGHSVLQEIRANPETALTPVVVLSYSNARKDVQKAYALHENGYIKKPRDLDGIFRAMDSLRTFWLELAELPS